MVGKAIRGIVGSLTTVNKGGDPGFWVVKLCKKTTTSNHIGGVLRFASTGRRCVPNALERYRQLASKMTSPRALRATWYRFKKTVSVNI